jgi:hypothetical protein
MKTIGTFYLANIADMKKAYNEICDLQQGKNTKEHAAKNIRRIRKIIYNRKLQMCN